MASAVSKKRIGERESDSVCKSAMVARVQYITVEEAIKATVC
jgi:hypothetical protein